MRLPTELIYNICFYFDAISFHMFFSQNKEYSLIREDPLLWKTIASEQFNGAIIETFYEYIIMYTDRIYGLYHINTYEFNLYIKHCRWGEKWLEKTIMNKYNRNDIYAKELVKDIIIDLFLVNRFREREEILKRGLCSQDRWDMGIAFYYAIDEIQRHGEKTKDKLDNYAKYSLKTKVFDLI